MVFVGSEQGSSEGRSGLGEKVLEGERPGGGSWLLRRAATQHSRHLAEVLLHLLERSPGSESLWEL